MADDNKPIKYMRYAIGEIALVVIGILIALQINNWNINNEKDGQFNMALDQIYTSLKYDYEMQKWHIAKFNEQLIVIDSLGTIEEGKIADLILLEANPLLSIENTKRINSVFYNGKHLDRSKLDEILDNIEILVHGK